MAALSRVLTDHISIGLLTSFVPREVIDTAVAVHGRQARRSGGALPPHVMVYFVIAMALFADADYEEVLTQWAEPLTRWGSWDEDWSLPTTSAITQARQRLGSAPVREVFEQVAVAVATALTRGAWCAGRRLVSIDGYVLDVADTAKNRAFFGAPSGGAYPKARVVSLNECASHVSLAAWIGGVLGKGTGERTAAKELIERLDETMMLIADSGFFSFALWGQAVDTGADLLWRVGDTLTLPVVAEVADGSHTSVVFAAGVSATARARLLERARAGEDLTAEWDRVRVVRVVEYYVDGRRDRELIVLLTSRLDPADAPAGMLAEAYHQRWEHENANDEIKTELRGPGRVLRSDSPDMVRQEIYGYLLAHYAISALICQAATETDIDPDRVKFARTVRLARRRVTDPAAFSP